MAFCCVTLLLCCVVVLHRWLHCDTASARPSLVAGTPCAIRLLPRLICTLASVFCARPVQLGLQLLCSKQSNCFVCSLNAHAILLAQASTLRFVQQLALLACSHHARQQMRCDSMMNYLLPAPNKSTEERTQVIHADHSALRAIVTHHRHQLATLTRFRLYVARVWQACRGLLKQCRLRSRRCAVLQGRPCWVQHRCWARILHMYNMLWGHW